MIYERYFNHFFHDTRFILPEYPSWIKNAYHLFPLRIANYDEFRDITADYYNYHYTRCVTNGGRFSGGEARSAARTILENEYRRRRGDIVSAFNDAHEGTN